MHAVFEHQLRQGSFGRLSTIVSIGLPVTELLIAFLLLFGKTRKAGLWCSTVLMSVFTVYVFVMLTSGTKLPCSCGGVIAAMSWKQHLIFNAAVSRGAWWGVKSA